MSGARDRRHELLADRALGALPEAEARELDALGGAEDDSFDRADPRQALLDRGVVAAARAGEEIGRSAGHPVAFCRAAPRV